MPVIHFNYQSRRAFRYTYHPPEEIRIEREIRRLQQEDKPFGAQKIRFLSRNTLTRIIEVLAQTIGLRHPRLLRDHHFLATLPGWKASLIGLYSPHLAIDGMLDRLGIERLKALPVEEQIKLLKAMDNIRWEKVPPPTILWMLNRIKERAINEKGVPCPHLRALIHYDLKKRGLPEIGIPLGGLYNHYLRLRPKEYPGTSIEYMLDRLGVEEFKELSIEMQCACLKYHANWPWEKVPQATVLYLLDRARQEAGLPHLRYLGVEHLFGVHLAEIDGNLSGLYMYFKLGKKDDSRDVIDLLLDHYGIPKFEEMPLPLQVGWTHNNPYVRWSRVSDEVISYYLGKLAQQAGHPSRVRQLDFFRVVPGKTASNLYEHLKRRFPATIGAKRLISSAFAAFTPLSPEHEARFQAGIMQKRIRQERLSRDEVNYLLQRAAWGDAAAVEHLLFFYDRLLKWLAGKFARRAPFDDLFQVARVEFLRLVKAHDSARGAKFSTYIIRSIRPLLVRYIIQENKNRGISLRAKVGENIALEQTIADKSLVTPEEAVNYRELLSQAFEGPNLSEKEKEILRLRCFEDQTLEAIGEKFKMTGERIRQIEARALKKIRKRLTRIESR
jgi:RNA polymerase sigma factor (sigma-70 family)